MKPSDLHRKRADMMDMCEGTHVHHLDCIKLGGSPVCKNPQFNGNVEDYTFALAIVEDKPVFAGDVLYDGTESVRIIQIEDRGNILCRARCDFYLTADELKNYTWTKPDEFAHILRAQAEGKRIVFYDGAKWVDTDVIDTVNFKPESYKVADEDSDVVVNQINPFNCKGTVAILWTMCGITGKISAEVIE